MLNQLRQELSFLQSYPRNEIRHYECNDSVTEECFFWFPYLPNTIPVEGLIMIHLSILYNKYITNHSLTSHKTITHIDTQLLLQSVYNPALRS